MSKYILYIKLEAELFSIERPGVQSLFVYVRPSWADTEQGKGTNGNYSELLPDEQATLEALLRGIVKRLEEEAL